MNRFLFAVPLILLGAAAFGQETKPATTAPVAPAAKAPIPNAAALKKAGDLVNEVYGKEIAKAVNPEQKAALAKKLLPSGIDESGDHAARYVLLGMAMDMAVQAADIDTVFAAVGEQVKGFEVDGLKLKADTLAKLGKVRGADATVLAEQCNRLIDEAVVADRYDVAKQVAEQGVVLAKENGGSVKAATGRQQEVKTIEAGHEQAQKALAILATDPNNTAAYLTAGRFLCFLKGDWEKGVPMLSNSSDKALKAVADMEVAKPTEPAKQVELADGWWELAKKEQGLSQRNLRSHSAEWYKKALPSLTGVLKLKAEIRLEEIERTAEDSSLWAVIFRSDDPSIWNTNVNEGKNRFAVALSRLPNNTRFVRIKQVATDKYIIIPIRKEQLGNKNTAPVRYRWNGSNEMLFGGNHLGVFDAEGGTAIGRIELAYGLTGWGFGHVAGPGGRAWGWAGANVNKSVFEIAIKTETLTATEGRFLLGPIVPPVRPKN